MKRFFAISSISAVVLVLSLTTISSDQSKRSIRKNGLAFSKMKLGFSKALAAAPTAAHQEIYDTAKEEVNAETKGIVDGVNRLLTAAGISSCENIPAVSGTAFHTSTDGGSLFFCSRGTYVCNIKYCWSDF